MQVIIEGGFVRVVDHENEWFDAQGARYLARRLKQAARQLEDGPIEERPSALTAAAQKLRGVAAQTDFTTYKAPVTGQVTEPGSAWSPSLVVHEANEAGDGPLCGHPMPPWQGKPMSFTPQGPGIVDCGNCIRVRASARVA